MLNIYLCTGVIIVLVAFLTFVYWPIVATILLSIVVILVTGLLIYASSLPVPSGLPQPWILRASVMASKIMGLVGRNLYDVLAYWPAKSSRKITNTIFDGVPVRIYEPPEWKSSNAGPLPAVVVIHGGGFRCLSVDTLHPFTDDMATKLNVVVISIEYRLSTEAIYPASIDDCTKATVWFLRHIKEYNVDCRRIAIMGESAGGNLAAAVTQRLTFDTQYKDLPTVRLQLLICPMLQAFDFNTPSYQQYGRFETALLSKEILVDSWSQYLTGSTELADKLSANMHTSPSAKRSMTTQSRLSHDLIPDRFKTTEHADGYVEPNSTNFGDESVYQNLKVILDPNCAPLMRESLKGLPEAYVATCTYDILRDDGILYVKKLEADGVKVTWVNYEDGVHAMSHYCAEGPFALKAGVRSRRDLFEFVNSILNT